MHQDIENIIRTNLPEKKDEIIIEDCENCGGEGYGKAWYGKGKPNDPYGYGEAYYPTGSVVFCKECSPDFQLGKIWDGEEIWKRTSDSENHTELRLNNIKKKVEENVVFNQALSQINTSLIADEVLKVVVEKIREEVEKINFDDFPDKIPEAKYGISWNYKREWKDKNRNLKRKFLQLLSNLSPNKKNKNNE